MLIPLIVSKIAATVGVSASLLFSVCFVETGFRTVNNYKDGNGGSYGICQMNERTARSFMPYVDRLALQQPSVNLKVAALYLKKLQDKYNNLKHTISAYNAGYARMVNSKYKNSKYVTKVVTVFNKVSEDKL